MMDPLWIALGRRIVAAATAVACEEKFARLQFSGVDIRQERLAAVAVNLDRDGFTTGKTASHSFGWGLVAFHWKGEGDWISLRAVLHFDRRRATKTPRSATVLREFQRLDGQWIFLLVD